jgi:hypothetical protein
VTAAASSITPRLASHMTSLIDFAVQTGATGRLLMSHLTHGAEDLVFDSIQYTPGHSSRPCDNTHIQIMCSLTEWHGFLIRRDYLPAPSTRLASRETLRTRKRQIWKTWFFHGWMRLQKFRVTTTWCLKKGVGARLVRTRNQCRRKVRSTMLSGTGFSEMASPTASDNFFKPPSLETDSGPELR